MGSPNLDDCDDLVTPGSTVGPWVVGRCLGAGSAASVYEAVHADLGRRVALKVLHRRHGFSSLMRARIVREGQAATRVRHPAVVQVFDVGLHEDRPFLVMDLLDGETLAARIAREAPMSSTAAVAVLLPLIASVAAVHAAGIVHRDIKPGNVVLVPDASGDARPTLLDFGLSRFEHPVSDGASLTGPDGVIGTPAYMSPEQALGSRILDGRSDQFALGVILYECLTGHRPFSGGTWQQTLLALSQCQPVPVRRRQTDVPVVLEAIVHKAMAREPAARFSDVRTLGDALIPFALSTDRDRWAALAGGVRPVPVMLPARGVWAPRHRGTVALTFTGMLVVMAGGVALRARSHGLHTGTGVYTAPQRDETSGPRVSVPGPTQSPAARTVQPVDAGTRPVNPERPPQTAEQLTHRVPRRVLGHGPNHALILAH